MPMTVAEKREAKRWITQEKKHMKTAKTQEKKAKKQARKGKVSNPLKLWSEALKKHNFGIPKKGTHDYNTVKATYEKLKRGEHVEQKIDLSDVFD
jgi:hypothetical protein